MRDGFAQGNRAHVLQSGGRDLPKAKVLSVILAVLTSFWSSAWVKRLPDHWSAVGGALYVTSLYTDVA